MEQKTNKNTTVKYNNQKNGSLIIIGMKVTGNDVKAKIAQFHNIAIEDVVMNTLYWEILAKDHAALVWYSINADAYNLPYAAVAIDDELYINETCRISNVSDIMDTDTVWMRLSDGVAFNGAGIMEFVNNEFTDNGTED